MVFFASVQVRLSAGIIRPSSTHLNRTTAQITIDRLIESTHPPYSSQISPFPVVMQRISIPSIDSFRYSPKPIVLLRVRVLLLLYDKQNDNEGRSINIQFNCTGCLNFLNCCFLRFDLSSFIIGKGLNIRPRRVHFQRWN